ncbi:MAG: branched-chain amino acid ABC transporter permease [Deltaproteobacteria bacterium]|nr:branched-chain amino acid ABC transporter permease [Deltaproteobacteria bacterium]
MASAAQTLGRYRTAAAVVGALAVIPLVPGLNSSYVLHMFILMLMWSVIGMAWNLLGGYCGQVSFGHAAFFGLGAYTGGILYYHLGWSAWWGLPVGMVVVTLGALGVGYICLRLRGPYFALGTLAMGEVLRVTAENLEWLTEGTRGIMLETRTWVAKEPFYYVILAIAVASFAVLEVMVRSKWGYYFVAIREDQDAAESLGIDTTLYKTIALVVSAVLTGVAGAFYTCYMGYIDPEIVFALHDVSIVTIMVVMVGGVATRWGPLVGAVIMILLSEVVRTLPYIGRAHQTLFGILLIVIIIFLPNGVVGDFRKMIRFFLGRSKPAGAGGV